MIRIKHTVTGNTHSSEDCHRCYRPYGEPCNAPHCPPMAHIKLSDFCKLMNLIQACEEWESGDSYKHRVHPISDALNALREERNERHR